MDNKKLQHYFLVMLLLAVAIFAFLILYPFFYIIILSLVCAIIFWPIRKKINALLGNRQGLAALFTTIMIITIILCPLIFLGIQIFQEAQYFYSFLTKDGAKDAVSNMFNSSLYSLQKYFPLQQEFSVHIDLDQYIKQGLLWLLSHLDNIFGSITKLLFNFFIFIIVTYYVLKDGQKLKKFIIKLSPLTDDHDEIIFKKINIAIHSVVKGNLVIAFIQGVLAAVGFAFFGVPNVILWGTAATIAAFIPGIGTAMVLIPAIVFIFFTKGILFALGLLAWGVMVVGLIDNLLRPKLIGHGMKIHPLIIFLSVLGGIAFLGPIGFLLGPLTMSFLFAVLDLYFSLAKKSPRL